MTTNDNGYEIVVGIPTYMEADNIDFVTKQVDIGLEKYFSNYKCTIVNVDNNSEDDTKGVFLNTVTKYEKHYITTPKGVRGKGNNFFNLFKFCQKNSSTLKAVVVVDADLRSITPKWIKFLLEPILNNYDYALPRYSRHQFDGTITNHICYPLIYGLLGQDIRQPIGGEFSFSPKLLHYWMEQKWLPTTRQYGIDIFMTMHAIMGKFKIAEVGLGAKIHKASAPKLGPMFTQVVTTFFDALLSNKASWIGLPIQTPKSKSQFGIKKLDPPQELEIDIRQLKQKLIDEYQSRHKLLKKYLNQYAITRLESMFKQDYYSMDILMWTQIVYQLLFAYDMGTKRSRADIIEALKPLYFARSVTYDYTTWKYNINYAEQTITEQAMAFSSQKTYLIGLYYNSCAAQ